MSQSADYSEMQVFDKGDYLETNISQGMFSPVYKIHVLKLIEAFNLSLTGTLTDVLPRIRARSCVLAILDQKMKNELLDEYDNEIKRIRALTIDNDQKGEMYINLAQNAVSKVYDWLDVDMGLWQKLQIGKI